MGTNNVVFLEVIEWLDPSGKAIVQRIPEGGSGEIKFGAQLVVRESQAAVFFYNGKAYEAFGKGRHTLKTANIPLLTKVLSVPWAMTSPLRAEVYFVNLKVFTNLKWGTRDPVAFKDSRLGLVRLRAFGVFNVRVVQPILLINSLVGTQGLYTTEEIEEYLNRVIVSRLNDCLGEKLDSLLDLPGQYDELSSGLADRLRQDFGQFGLELPQLYINSITPPPEVQQAIDDKSRLAVFEDLNRLMQMKMAMAVENMSSAQGEAGAGLGMGMGLLMPAMMSRWMTQGPSSPPSGPASACPECGQPVPDESRFCLHCGHQLVVISRCGQCGKNLPPHARFCSRCGKAVELKQQPKSCPHCGTENLAESVFCNQCGERLQS